MKKIEKYVWWVSLITLALNIGGVFWVYSMNLSFEMTNRALYQFVVQFLPNVIFAIWVGWAASKMQLKKIPWGFFAFMYGIQGVAIFYILAIYYNLTATRRVKYKKKSETNQTNEP